MGAPDSSRVRSGVNAPSDTSIRRENSSIQSQASAVPIFTDSVDKLLRAVDELYTAIDESTGKSLVTAEIQQIMNDIHKLSGSCVENFPSWVLDSGIADVWNRSIPYGGL